MPSTEKLPSGRWRPIVHGSDGKKIHGLNLGTFARKRDAQHVASDEEAKYRRQVAVTSGHLPAKTTWGDWWDTIAPSRTFDSENDHTEKHIVTKYLIPEWGDTPLNKISNRAVQRWIDRLAEQRKPDGGTYAASYIRRIYSVFTASINIAIEEGVLTASPLAKIKLPKVPRRAKPYTSVDDADKLATHKLRSDYTDVVAFGLETGLRPGELAGLHDEQVDEHRRVLTVRTVYLPRRKQMRTWPKDFDDREIPLTAAALEIYDRRTAGRDMRQRCGVEHRGEPCASDVVFRSPRGAVLNIDALGAAMRRASRRAQLPYKSPYGGRRGFATRHREAGTDVFDLMDLMGHSTIDQTRGYAQKGPDFRQRVLAALGDPEAMKLRVVGQGGDVDGDGDRGIDHGTQVDSASRNDAKETGHRKHT